MWAKSRRAPASHGDVRGKGIISEYDSRAKSLKGSWVGIR
jgi:hypothetical protein